jgi:outer membrane protein assembly factor BamB
VEEKSSVLIPGGGGSEGLTHALTAANSRVGPFDNKISFQIRTSRRNGSLSFYSTETGGPENPAYKPRLVLTYSHPDSSLTPLDWRQLHHDAQHTGRSSWRIYNRSGRRDYFPTEVRAKSIYSADLIYGDPVIYKEKLYDVVKAGGEKFYLRRADRKGRIGWEAPLDGIPIQPLAVNQHGRLYYVTENQVETYDLENGGARGDRPIPIDKNRDTVISPPVLGPDGTLYLTTKPYLYAYSPYPQHQLLWKQRRGGYQVSAVALSEDGESAYIVDATAGELIALSAADGEKKWIVSEIKLNIGENDPMPIPVVAEDTIYVTSGFPNGDKLYVLHDQRTKGALTTLVGTGICTPVVGPDKTVYFVKDGRLSSYRPDREPQEINKTVFLGKVSNLVIDGSGNVYSWNKNTHWLYAFDKSGAMLYQRNLRTRNLGPNLLIAPDGSLYNSNSQDLQAIVPSAFGSRGNQLDLDQDMVRSGNNSVFRAGSRISVKQGVVVEGSQSIILISGKEIGFSPGFKVEKGGRIICETGF